MPVYLFTYHTYGSWMPDRPQGYVRRGEGVLPTDHAAADAYRRRMKQDAVLLDEEQQKAVIDFLLAGAGCLDAALHAIAAEPTHVHALVSWRDERPHAAIGTSLKRAMTINLKRAFGGGEWFSENRSRRRIEDREHFDHLVANYLPGHRGWNWNEERGFFKAGRRLNARFGEA